MLMESPGSLFQGKMRGWGCLIHVLWLLFFAFTIPLKTVFLFHLQLNFFSHFFKENGKLRDKCWGNHSYVTFLCQVNGKCKEEHVGMYFVSLLKWNMYTSKLLLHNKVVNYFVVLTLWSSVLKFTFTL